MADNNLCTECGEELVNGLCGNQACDLKTNRDQGSRIYGSLSPESMASLDPSEIVDYTGTIGTAPGEFGSGLVEDLPVGGEEEFAQTRMVDDDFYQQVQTFFPADSGSQSAGSASAAKSENRDPHADYSRSISMREDRSNLSIDDFIPPVREIKFPSDSASLDQIRELDPETIEGDEYHITEKLGEGGYGIVFEADQMALNRPVAIKVLKPKKRKGSQSKSPSQSGTGTGELQRRRDQFLHEAKITARLQHPNIVPLYDFGINSTGQLFYSMKKVERRPWSSVLHRPDRLLSIPSSEVDELAERQAISRNIEIFSRVCDAMAYAHSMKVVHRDLKPDNIMIGNYGEVLLIDFGMALDLSETGSRDFSAGGTLVYMSPEMAQHFSKQKEIQIAAQKTAQVLGVDKGTIFLDQSNIVGVGSLAQRLIRESQDQGVVELAETLIGLDAEEKQLAKQIGYSSDIYLLGAILYQIAVGHPPHYFPLSLCKKGQREKFQNELWLALRNGFQKYNKIDDPLRISLREIAIRAMRTDPADRFQTVEELQVAIRGFQKQVQSLELTESGKEELDKAKGREDYQHLLPALESFRGANELWPEGTEASQLRRTAACEYAKRATKRRDYDAGLSILDEYVLEENQSDKPVVEVRQKLVKGKKRTERNRRLAVVGWAAAILLPLAAGIWAYPLVQKAADAELRAVAAGETAIKAEEQKTLAEKSKAAAEVLAQNAVELERKAKERLASSEQELLKVAPQLKEAENVKKELTKLRPELRKQKTELANAEKDRQQAEKDLQFASDKLANANQGIATANAAKIEAEKAADLSKRLASKFQFDADFRQYNSNVLTIPLDFRTSKLKEAGSKLDALEASDAKPQFKNGWLVKHFAKQLKSGKRLATSENASVVDLVNISTTDEVLAIVEENGKTAVWKIGADDSVSKLSVSIDQAGDLVDASVSSNGKFLGLAYDATEDIESSGNVIVVNIDNGNVSRLPTKNLEKIAGCRHVQFSNSDANRLVVVEELKGFYELKQRVHVVEYRIDGNSLSELSRNKVDATNRTEDRIGNYLASTYWNGDKPVTAIAYDSLDNDGAEIQKLEVVSGTNESTNAVKINRFPTALLMGSSGKLYCGHRDGAVDSFDATNLGIAPKPVDGNLNGNEIAVLAESENGALMAGSKNGQIVIWQADRKLSRKVDGQEGQLTSLAITEEGRILSGGDAGSVNVWKPGGEYYKPASIGIPSKVTVTCGAIDQSLEAGSFPATAYGTQSGDVIYFDSDAMKTNESGKVFNDGSEADISAKFRFKAPFAAFDNAFDDFDSMGIIDDWFVVMKNDGTLVATLIDEAESRRDVASSKMRSFDEHAIDKSNRGYIPLMGSVYNRDYFYTNDPSDEQNLLLWRRSGSRFTSVSVNTSRSNKGQIKRLVMSPDGKWLAVVRLANRRSGEYRTEVLDVSGGEQQIRVSQTSNLYRVGDPAFVGFSDDSTQLMFHRHTIGTDRKTFVEFWDLAGSQWTESSTRPQLVADQKVDLIDWSNSSDIDEVVTRFNRNYYLKPIQGNSKPTEFAKIGQQRLRNVLSAGPKQFYVLTSSSLARYDAEKQKPTEAYDPQNARDMRVYGKRVVILDQKGFHLFDSDLQYVTKLASRKASVEAVSLSGQKLAICYDNQLCRIWNVGGVEPEAIGLVNDTSKIELSPDGNWAACLVGEKVQIFDVGSKFDAPKSVLDDGGTFRWSGKENSTLIVATKRGDKTDWTEFDPATGGLVRRADFPSDAIGVDDFNLAPLTENFLAIQNANGISVWATGEVPKKMTLEDEEFDSAPLRDIKAITFSEISQPNQIEIGTRMAVLAGDGIEPNPVARIYLLAKQLQESAGAGEADGTKQFRYRVVEVEGALQSNTSNALKLKSLEFSGDGKSLLKIHDRGTSTLLSE